METQKWKAMQLLLLIIVIFILFILLGFGFNYIYNKYFKIQPKATQIVTPPVFSNTIRTALCSIIITLPKTIKTTTTVKGILYESDYGLDDEIQNFTITVVAGSKTAIVNFNINVVNVGGDEQLKGNTSDYSAVEDVWHLYAEIEGGGQLSPCQSNVVAIPWMIVP